MNSLIRNVHLKKTIDILDEDFTLPVHLKILKDLSLLYSDKV